MTQENPDKPAEERLEDIVDDTDPRQDALEWAAREMLKGRSVEDVSAELAKQGWSGEDLEEMVETARKATRHARGVRTREDVVRDSQRRFRRSVRGVWIIAVLAVGLLIALVTRYFGLWK